MTNVYFPQYSPADRVALYATWGGVPAYWERLEPDISVMGNLSEQLLPAKSLILDEPRLLLQDFINDPYNYVGVMRAITFGAQSAGDIMERTGLKKGHVSKYLSILRDTTFVTREVPVTEFDTDSRRGRYLVTDPYLRFFYRFLSADQSKLALGEQQQVLDSISESLPQFIEAYTWREICQEWLLRASAREEIPLSVERVGSEWKPSYTIDVVGINESERNMILGACVWNDEPADVDLIQELVKRTSAIVPKDETWSVYYLGFASNGWKDSVAEQADQIIQTTAKGKSWQSVGVRLLDLDEVDADLSRWPGFLAPSAI